MSSRSEAVTSGAAKLLQNVAGGSALNGVLQTKTNGIEALPKQIIQCPKDVKFIGSTLDFKEETLDLDSRRQYEIFDNLLSSFGIKTAAELAIKGDSFIAKGLSIEGKGSFDYKSNRSSNSTKESQGDHHFSAVIDYAIFPKAAVKIKAEDLRLEKSVVKDLQDLEKTAQSCFEIDTIGTKAEKLIKAYGSHVSVGVINFGGVYQTRATHETKKDLSKIYIQDKLHSAAKAGCSGSFSLSAIKASGSYDRSDDTDTTSKQKIDDKNEIIHVSKMHSGGSKTAENMDEWKKDIQSQERWAIIDRSRDFTGLWDIIENQQELFTHAKGLGLLLEYHWHKMDDGAFRFEIADETSCNDLVNLLTKTILQELKAANKGKDGFKIEKFVTQLKTRFDWLGECLCKYTRAYDSIFELVAELKNVNQTLGLKNPDLESLCGRMQESLKPDFKPVNTECYGALTTLSTKKWSCLNSANISEEAESMTLIGSCLYVSLGKEGLQIYSMELKHLCTIKSREMGAILDSDEVTGGDLIVAATAGLFFVQQNGTALLYVASGHYTGVRVHEGLTYAAKQDVMSSVIEVYENYHGNWQRRQIIHLPCKKEHVTLHVTNNVIYAGCRETNIVYMVSKDGQILGQQGESGSTSPGIFSSLTICHGDREGSVLVADRTSSCLQVLDSNKRWYVIDIKDKIPLPKGAVYTQDRLYVLHRYSPGFLAMMGYDARNPLPNTTLTIFQPTN